MPSANQYLLIDPPGRGFYNVGPPWTAPSGSATLLQNLICSRGTGRLVRTRWAATRNHETVQLPGSQFPVYVGDAGTFGTNSVPPIIITKNFGGTNGRMYYWNSGGAAWADLSGGVTLTQTTNDLTWTLFDKAGTVWFLFSNGIEIKKWNRSVASNYAAWAAAPEAFKACMVVADRLIVGNLATSGSQWVDCSASIDFEAGWNINMVKLATTPGKIVAMRSMGATQGVIYCEDAIYLVIPQAGPAPFRYELRVSGIAGPASERAVVQLPDGTHIYLGRDGEVYRFDGSSLTQACPLASYPLSNVPADILADASGLYWPQRGEVYFFHPRFTPYGLSDPAASSGGVCISYPEMACFPLAFANWYGAAPPTATKPIVSITCCGLIRPPDLGIARGPEMRELSFGSISFMTPAPVTTVHLGLSYDAWCADGGTWWGNGDPVVSIIANWTSQEIVPASAGLVSLVEVETIVGPPEKGYSGFPDSQSATVSAKYRLGGIAGYYVAAPINVRATGRKVSGFSNSSSCQSAAVEIEGHLYSHTYFYGARLALYAGQEGRR